MSKLTEEVSYKCPDCGLETQFKNVDMNGTCACPKCQCPLVSKDIVAHTLEVTILDKMIMEKKSMSELKVCPECGHVEGNQIIKTGDRLWFHGIHYIIATVDARISIINGTSQIGIQLINPDNGTRCAQHPVYVSNSNNIKKSELIQLMTYGSECNSEE